MHETVEHDRYKTMQTLLGNNYIIFNIVPIVQYAMDSSAELCRSLPWKQWGACFNTLYHVTTLSLHMDNIAG